MSRKKGRRSIRNKNELRPDSGARPKKTQKKRFLENQKEKFRKSKEWKDFRSHMAIVFNHRDYITGKRLIKGFNLHHLKTDQTSESYCDITNESEFIPLNSYCHKLLHYLFTFYRKDPTVIDRLVEILDRMNELASSDDGELVDEMEDGEQYGEVGELFEAEVEGQDSDGIMQAAAECLVEDDSDENQPEIVE